MDSQKAVRVSTNIMYMVPCVSVYNIIYFCKSNFSKATEVGSVQLHVQTVKLPSKVKLLSS